VGCKYLESWTQPETPSVHTDYIPDTSFCPCVIGKSVAHRPSSNLASSDYLSNLDNYLKQFIVDSFLNILLIRWWQIYFIYPHITTEEGNKKEKKTIIGDQNSVLRHEFEMDGRS
jgi:hypothetical protein